MFRAFPSPCPCIRCCNGSRSFHRRYTFAWYPLLHSFLYNVSDAERGPPDFVYAIIYSQVGLFSCFGITQFVSLWRVDGPSVYWLNEASYCILSLLAKGVLGLLLMANVSDGLIIL